MAAERLTGLCMPYSVLIFTEKGKTKIAAMHPGAVMPQIFSQAAQRLGDLPKKINGEIRSILDIAAR